MFWYGHDPSGWGWFTMSVGMLLFWALLIVFAVVLFRAVPRSSDSGTKTGTRPGPTPEQILAERFARGEIDEEEYRSRLAVLRPGCTGYGNP
ncbi:SHOCT domain-containing protein [Streptomyces sp. NBC_00151]|uniref:SHOCT domain-containing protein n=1 Tax=Streptomyces sp. NBC_00151 TaxID=2975669 RepID=UPI002DDBC2BA|nr:SHOCT domain-containing protein [Streptomyces sp. NBC_00151]WRZ45499.1 SHOCT domain-containing protein [Streptomyces sp. NBC_00151]